MMENDKRRQYIMEEMKRKLKWLQSNTEHEVAYIALQGSQNYGMDCYNDKYQSDIDAKAFILPSFQDLLKSKKMVSKVYVMKDDSHIEVKDIRLMPEQWKKANPTYLELLFTEFYIMCNPYIEQLREMADEIAEMNTKALLSSINGMARAKFNGLLHISPASEASINTFGYDAKQLHHLIRLSLMLEYVFRNNKSLRETFVLDTETAENLLRVKTEGCYNGVHLDRTDAVVLAQHTLEKIDAISKEVSMTPSIFKNDTYEKLNEIIYRMIEENIKKSIIL